MTHRSLRALARITSRRGRPMPEIATFSARIMLKEAEKHKKNSVEAWKDPV